jgi:methylglutaconyl-CoA hydratase
VPIVTRVHGKVVGGGVGIVAASDYALATETASLRLSELAVGIGPFVVGPVIERKAGTAVLSAMGLDADWRTAIWGAQHGLYARLAENLNALESGIGSLAQQLARSNPEATALIKRATWAGTEDWTSLLEERAAMSGRLVLSEYTKKAIAAFSAR